MRNSDLKLKVKLAFVCPAVEDFGIRAVPHHSTLEPVISTTNLTKVCNRTFPIDASLINYMSNEALSNGVDRC